MKIRILLLTVLTIYVSCTPKEQLDDFACERDFQSLYDANERNYDRWMSKPDSQGNDQSLEACTNRLHITENYISLLKENQAKYFNSNECSSEQATSIIEDYNYRIRQLEEDIENIWSRCEEVFGDG